MFLTVFSTYFHTVRNITKLDQIFQFELSKEAVVVSNFYLIRKILHNFLVPKMIELACLQDFHAYSDLRSTQSALRAQSVPKKLSEFLWYFGYVTLGSVFCCHQGRDREFGGM